MKRMELTKREYLLEVKLLVHQPQCENPCIEKLEV